MRPHPDQNSNFVASRFSLNHARNIFLSTYYDPFYAELHLYTITPHTPQHSTIAATLTSWLSIPSTLWQEGWSAFSSKITHSVTSLIHDGQQYLWETLGDGSTQITVQWPPT